MTMIELTTLRYFTSAFEARTFSQAARVNDVSQPTVSAAIQKLEDRLGVSLFQRSKAGLTPTPFATRLYHDTVDSVAHLSSIDMRLRREPQQTVRIHCAPDMLLKGVATGLNALRIGSPELMFGFTDDPENSDIAFLADSCTPADHDFILLAEESFRVAFGRFHPLARVPEVRLADLRDQPVIHRPYCPNADRMDLDALRSAAAEAMNDAQLLDLVAAGLGIAFVPLSHGDSRDDIVLRPLADTDTGHRRIGISHRKSVFAAQLAKRLAKVCAL